MGEKTCSGKGSVELLGKIDVRNGRALITCTSQYPQRCVFIPVSSCEKQNGVLSTSYVCFHREENQELIKLKVDSMK